MKPLQVFIQIPLDHPELPSTERNLYRASTAFLLYTPIMLLFSCLGLILIYVIAAFGLLDNPDPKLLAVACISLLFSLIHLPLFPYAKKGNLEVVITGLLITSILSGIVQIFIWAGVIWFPLVLLIILPTFTFVYLHNIRKQLRIGGFFVGLLACIAVSYLDNYLDTINYQRMDFSSLSQIAGFTIYLLVIATLIILAILNGVISFHSITSRLITTFAFVAILSTVSTLVISSLASLFQDRQLAINQLETISNSKKSQIIESLAELEQDTDLILQDQSIAEGINFLLNTPQSNSQLYIVNYDLVKSHLQTLQEKSKKYNEILILDTTGKAVLSTVEKNKNRKFSQHPFFYQISNEQKKIFLEKNFPEAKEDISLLIIKSFFGKTNQLNGILLIRSNLNDIENITKSKDNIDDRINNYLIASIDNNGLNIIKIGKENVTIDVNALEQAIKNNWIFYNNTETYPFFTHYTAIKNTQISLITEIKQEKIAQSTINLLFTNLLSGLFTATLAFAIIYITAKSISNPIISLAHKANALATGEMSTRITIDRKDEIGRLSSSFNTMAEQLQNLVRTLEEKVENRTQGLRVQANRLLLAAEIARDAATLGDLNELLNRSAQLVLDRFDFYHTGIFLIDQQHEYAILRASPTDAGNTMLKQNYRLKIGKEGIVGNVAITGEAKIVADTNLDIIYLNNPLLPQTRSQLAIPLKVETRVIGVLDVQSKIPNAFTQDDIAVLQIMADQLALAIERVQLLKQLEGRLSELEHAYQQFTLTSWQDFSQQPDFKAGYSFDGIKLSTINSFPMWSQDAIKQGRSIVLPGKTTNTKDSLLAVPLRLRGQTIGVLTIHFRKDTLNTETISLSEEIANRLAVALENARLYTETQNLALQERTVSEISTRITASINIENILRTAVQEISRIAPNAEITVELQEEKEV